MAFLEIAFALVLMRYRVRLIAASAVKSMFVCVLWMLLWRRSRIAVMTAAAVTRLMSPNLVVKVDSNRLHPVTMRRRKV